MAFTDYGQPGEPLSAPSLSDWAASVADELLTSRDYVGYTALAVTPATGWTGNVYLYRSAAVVVCVVLNLAKTAPVANEVICTFPTGYKPPATQWGAMFTLNVNTGSGKSELAISPTGLQTFATPIASFKHTGQATWITYEAWPTP